VPQPLRHRAPPTRNMKWPLILNKLNKKCIPLVSLLPAVLVLSVAGVHFPTDDEHLLTELSKAVRVFLEGLEQLSLDEGNEVVLSPHLSCEGRAEARWRKGDKFFRSVQCHCVLRSSAECRERRQPF
jgi:hypothetical protein